MIWPVLRAQEASDVEHITHVIRWLATRLQYFLQIHGS